MVKVREGCRGRHWTDDAEMDHAALSSPLLYSTIHYTHEPAKTLHEGYNMTTSRQRNQQSISIIQTNISRCDKHNDWSNISTVALLHQRSPLPPMSQLRNITRKEYEKGDVDGGLGISSPSMDDGSLHVGPWHSVQGRKEGEL